MQLRTFSTLVGLLVVTLTTVPLAAHAEGGGGPCRQDLQALCPNVVPGPGSFRACMETLCPGVTPGHGALFACLQQQADALSPACQERLRQVQAKMDAWRRACQSDVGAYCADVTRSRQYRQVPASALRGPVADLSGSICPARAGVPTSGVGRRARPVVRLRTPADQPRCTIRPWVGS
ncbi:MAG: hypothetical protein H6Q33_3513 [Deltaproteobacteria bacterium]|nr:hypothetical protein [Deltaproteobacteria bacterium]